MNVRTKVVLPEGADPSKYSVETSVWNPNKQKLTAVRTSLAQMKYNNNQAEQEFVIQAPSLWSPEMPALYSAETRLYEGDKLKDIYTTPFGIRSIEIIPDKVLSLRAFAITTISVRWGRPSTMLLSVARYGS